jgi:hypothetical protein
MKLGHKTSNQPVAPPALPNGQNAVPMLQVYVSQTGSDANSGLTELLPILTLNKAAEIAEATKPVVLKIYFQQPTVNANNIKTVAGYKVAPSFRCDLHLVFAANSDVTIGSFVQEGLTYPVKILASKNVLIRGDDGGEMANINSLTMPIINSAAYTVEQQAQFAAQNGFVCLNTFDFLPVECKVFSKSLSIKKNIFLFKNLASNHHRRGCHFQHLIYGSLNESMVANVEEGAGIVENFTSVTAFWKPAADFRLGVAPKGIFSTESSMLENGRVYRYSMREFLWDAGQEAYWEAGVNFGIIYWPERPNTSTLVGETMMEEFSNTSFGNSLTYEPIQVELWGNPTGKLTLSARRSVADPAINCVFQLSFQAI